MTSAARWFIEAQGLRAPYERALPAMNANRLSDPESRLGVWDRWLSKVYLPSCDGLQLNHMYEAMDLLHAHAEKVEEAIFFPASGVSLPEKNLGISILSPQLQGFLILNKKISFYLCRRGLGL